MPTRQRNPFRQLVSSIFSQAKSRLLLVAFCTFGLTATELLRPWPLKIILDHVVLDKKLPRFLGFASLWMSDKLRLLVAACAAILLLAFFRGIFSYFQAYITSFVGYRLVYTLRRQIFSHMQRLSLSFHNRSHSGDL